MSIAPPGLYVADVSPTSVAVGLTQTTAGTAAYRVRIQDTITGTIVREVELTGTAWVDGLQPGTTYSMFAMAFIPGQGWGDWTGVVYVGTRPVVPTAPIGLSVGMVDKNTLRAYFASPSYNGGAGIDSYWLSISRRPDFQGGITFTGPGSGIRIDALNPGTVYYARVRAHNAAGWGPFGNVASAQTLSDVKVFDGGVWKEAVGYTWRNGQWVPVNIWRGGADGTWKP